MRYVLALLALTIATPAPAQIRFFKDGSIILIGPSKEEKRRRQSGVMMGVMNHHPPAAQESHAPMPPSAILPPSAIPKAGQQPQQTGAEGN